MQADETPLSILDPGKGKTQRGYQALEARWIARHKKIRDQVADPGLIVAGRSA